MTMKHVNILRLVCFALTCILFVVGVRRAAHNEKQVEVEFLSLETKTDGADCYVYFNFDLKNQSMKDIEIIYVSTDFVEKNGLGIGSLTSKFTNLNLSSGKTLRQRTYLRERQNYYSLNRLFSRLYDHGMQGLTTESKIVYIKWKDGRTWGSSWGY